MAVRRRGLGRYAEEAAPPPEAYTWMFELRRDERGRLELYFYIGHWSDKVTYVLEKQA